MITALLTRVAACIGLGAHPAPKRRATEFDRCLEEAVAETEAEAFERRFLDDGDYHCPPPRALPRHAADFRPGVRNGWREDIDGIGIYRGVELEQLAKLTAEHGDSWKAAREMNEKDWRR